MMDKEDAFRIVWVDRPGLPALLPHWIGLVERNAEDNVYYAPHYAIPLLETVASNVGIRILTVWSGEILVGLFPITPNSLSFPGLIPAGQAWQTLFTFNCMPLIDRHDPLKTASALIKGLAGLRSGEWVIPEMNVDGPVWRAMIEALDAQAMPWLMLNEFDRAMLTAEGSYEDHVQRHLSSKRRRDLARNRRRLEERGQVSTETHLSGESLATAAEAFLRIEEGGWKGKRGTALASRDDTRQFALRAFNSANNNDVRIDLLLVNGTPIAAGVIVFAGGTGFTIKNAYDEAYAGYSAGLLLEMEVLRSLLTGKWAEKLDSATNGAHVIDGLWPRRRRVADLVFSSASARGRAGLAAYRRASSIRNWTRSGLKKLLKR